MASLQCLSFYCETNRLLLPISFPHFSSINKKMFKNGDHTHPFKRSKSSSFAVRVGEEEFEIDPKMAREALQKLDQQIQQLSQKQVSRPKIKAEEVKITRDDQTKDEELNEISGTTVALVTAALFIYTIFYNIFYITVIDKPR